MEMQMSLSGKAFEDLRLAKTLLENPGLAAKLTGLIGTPIEKSLEFLPAKWSGALQKSTMLALRSALRFAIITLGKKEKKKSFNRLHKSLVAATGGIGGAFGLPALAAELPISTIAIMRSIADIARSEGEVISDTQVRLACLEVFALGGNTGGDDSADTGYFAVRTALAQAVSDAAKHIAQKGLADKGAPAIVRLMTQIASRFNVAVSQKAAAQAVPIIGAASGMIINTIFMDHFQKMARGHFIVRRLERAYDPALVRSAYQSLGLAQK